MILAAMLDAGLPLDRLRSELGNLGLSGVDIAAQKVTKQGFAATQFEVRCEQNQQGPRHLADIRKIISDSPLSGRVKDRAGRIFTRLAEAEARAHGTGFEQVHFHEVGAADAIMDIVGACIGLEALQVDRAICSPIPPGSGTVRCEHGVMPVPAPGTMALLAGVPLAECDEPGELTTPTGAAILTSLAESYGPLPAMRVEAVGYGAGAREGQTRPNLHRLILGLAESLGEADEVVMLQANLDDATGQVVGYVTDKLLEAGALDVFTTPIGMKKGRPAVLITVLAEPQGADPLEELLFVETTTFGVRRWNTHRSKLQRAFEEVSTSWGPVRIKLGLRAGRCLSATPEYEDCLKLATERGVPLREVIQQAAQAARMLKVEPGRQNG